MANNFAVDFMSNNSILEMAEILASDLNSMYRNTQADRRNLLSFFEANEWFGITPATKPRATKISALEFERIKVSLTLWLRAYRQPGREKIRLMLQHYNEIYPITCRLYREFVESLDVWDEASAWKLLDYLLSELDCEITEYTEAELEELIKPLDTEASLVVAFLLADFLQTTKYNGKPLTKWAYSFQSRKNSDLTKPAYPMHDFATMAYCVFNEEMWEKQGLVEKAVESQKYADLWLFTALHFICALRVSDMKRLPSPSLPCSCEEILERISNKNFTKCEAVAIVDELSIRLNLKQIKPSKTSKHKNVPTIKLFVAESLKEPLGIIIALSLAHHPEVKPGDRFVFQSRSNLTIYRKFFGNHFMEAIGNKYFTSISCNKSYLQAVKSVADMDGDTEADDAPGKPKGYMLASLARSHKGGIGTLAKTTEAYLKDANFSGYNPEFIMREMFERGVFSFIPAILLEMYAGDKYKKLPISSQTQLIGDVGLSANQIEWLATAVDRTLEKSKHVVSTMLHAHGNTNKSVFSILQNIASGNAPSRCNEYLCLMTASGFPCAFSDRDSCLGCGYEIYTKAATHTLMKEYVRLTIQRDSADNKDAWRYGQLLKQAVYPAVAEMVAVAKLFYQDEDDWESSDILAIIENGIERGIESAGGDI